MEHIGNCKVGNDVGEIFVELEQEDPLETKIELHLPNVTYKSTLITEIANNSWTWRNAVSMIAVYVNKQLEKLSLPQH